MEPRDSHAIVVADLRQSAKASEVHASMLDRLRSSMDRQNYSLWIAPLQLVSVSDGVLRLSAPPHALSWVQQRYRLRLQEAASAAAGYDLGIELVATPQPSPSARSVSLTRPARRSRSTRWQRRS